jgi:hypothetical protein
MVIEHRLFRFVWPRGVVVSTALLLFWFGFWVGGHAALVKNGFDLSSASIAVAEIMHGGPPRDGIPAIDRPMFIMGSEADYLDDTDRVLGIYRNGIAKAYPVAILNWHEIVNDRIGREPIVITFCPLCGTGMAFEATVEGQVRHFGVSGLLYNSDVLLYDRESESLWSQIGREAVSGPLVGTTLLMVPVAHTAWADWRTRHPKTLVLSRRTGHGRDYGRNPYESYERSRDLYFPVASSDPRYHPKERVIGLELDGRFKAYPFVELGRAQAPLQDTLGGRRVTVHYDAEHRTGRVTDARGAEIPTVIAFWFAWAAFHPETEVFEAP